MIIKRCGLHEVHFDPKNGCPFCRSEAERIREEEEELERLRAENERLRAEKETHIAYAKRFADTVVALGADLDALRAERDTPEVNDFLKGIALETVHQRKRWGRDGDAGKAPADWFWLVGYLAGKALHAVVGGNVEKAKHHLITTAAALCNWHAAIIGKTDMRPGIEEP